MTMSDLCAGFRDSMMDAVDGPPRSHEAACAACADLARAVRAQAALLARLPRPAPPADLGARIERALGSRGTSARPRRRRAWTAAAAAALLAAVGLLASDNGPAAERSVRVVDVELPDRGSFLGRLSPTAENPGGSLLDPLVMGE